MQVTMFCFLLHVDAMKLPQAYIRQWILPNYRQSDFMLVRKGTIASQWVCNKQQIKVRNDGHKLQLTAQSMIMSKYNKGENYDFWTIKLETLFTSLDVSESEL